VGDGNVPLLLLAIGRVPGADDGRRCPMAAWRSTASRWAFSAAGNIARGVRVGFCRLSVFHGFPKKNDKIL
jgi:hypothetical protein